MNPKKEFAFKWIYLWEVHDFVVPFFQPNPLKLTPVSLANKHIDIMANTFGLKLEVDNISIVLPVVEILPLKTNQHFLQINISTGCYYLDSSHYIESKYMNRSFKCRISPTTIQDKNETCCSQWSGHSVHWCVGKSCIEWNGFQ